MVITVTPVPKHANALRRSALRPGVTSNRFVSDFIGIPYAARISFSELGLHRPCAK
jgi:hypothetical protein